MKRLIMMLLLVALAIPATAFASASPHVVTCTQTGFVRDGINLTAAKIGGKVTGNLDASGCDIGVYYGPGTKGSVSKAKIKNAKYFGVVNFRGKVDVKNSTISQIGNVPFDGMQHGIGVLYTTEERDFDEATSAGKADGTISGNVLSSYQKNGIVVRGAGASAKIEGNTVTGLGKVGFIAQNGIQVSFGGTATVAGNTVSGHWYTPDDDEACGLLFYQAGEVKMKQSQKSNHVFDNEVNFCNVNS